MGEQAEHRELERLADESWRRIFLENALDAVVGTDDRGTVIEWNRQAEVTFGWTKDQALGRGLAELIIPEAARDRHRRGMERFLQTGEGPILNRRVEVDALHRNGSHFPVELTVIPLSVSGHRVFYSFLRDVSERRAQVQQREEALLREQMLRSLAEASERQLRTIMDASPAFIAFLDRQARYTFVNGMYEKSFGRSAEELRGRTLADVAGEAAFDRAKPHLERALAGETVRYEATLTDHTGRPLQVEVECAPYRGTDDQVAGVVVIAHDISARKAEERDQQFLMALNADLATTRRVEELVTRATSALANHLDASRCWFAEIDDDTAVATVHQDYASGMPSLQGTCSLEVFGLEMVASWRRGGIITMHDVTTDPRTASHAASHLALGIRAFITAPIIRHGRFIGALNVSTPQPRLWGRREQVLVKAVAETLWPVIENARLISALTLERKRLESILEQLPAGVVLADERGRLLMRNARMDEILGGFVLAQSIEEYGHFVGRRPDGSTYSPTEWPLARALTGETVRDEEVRIVRYDQKEVTISLSAAPVRDEQGRVVAAVLVVTDITHHREMTQRLESAISARDEFLSLASHELRTPVTSMKLQFQSAAKQLEAGIAEVLDPARVAKRIELANRQLNRMTRLIEEMLDVSRIATRRLVLEREKVELGRLVEEVASRFESDFIDRGVQLQVEVSSRAVVHGDRFRLEQVIENLLTNAIKYGEHRPVHVRVESSNGRVRVLVEDEGMGLDPIDAERIFQRFERATSPNIAGLGLGLYISRQIAEAHGGAVWAEAREEKGSRFIFELPEGDPSDPG